MKKKAKPFVSLEESLLDAAARGMLDKVTQLVAKSLKVNHVSEDGRTALKMAALNGHLHVVRVLLEAGAAVNQADVGSTALICAAQNGHDLVILLLLQKGADINQAGADGLTALISAVQNGHFKALCALFSKKSVNVDQPNSEGVTALMLAARYGYIQMVGALIAEGAVLDRASCSGWNALILASQYGHLEIVCRLLDLKADPKKVTEDGRTALKVAALYGHENVVRVLLVAGADPNQITSDGFTAIMCAAQNGHDKVVRVLLEAKADANLSLNSKGWTALILAAIRGHVEAVRVLIEAGVNVNHVTVEGETALILAAQHGRVEVVVLLLKAGTDINQISIGSVTVLMNAILTGQVDVVRALLESGVNASEINSVGESALICAAQVGQVDVVRVLLDGGADANYSTPQGWTALMIAAENGHIKVVNLLFRHLLRQALSNTNTLATHLQSIDQLISEVQKSKSTKTTEEVNRRLQSYVEELLRKKSTLPADALEGFFQARGLSCSWKVTTTTGARYACVLNSDDHVTEGIIRGYLAQQGVETERHRDNGLSLVWNQKMLEWLSHSPLQTPVDDLSPFVKLQQELFKLLGIVCGVESFQTTSEGFEAVTSKQKTTVSTEVYTARQTNVLRLLDYVWQQCGLEANSPSIKLIESTLKSGTKAFHLTFDCLSQPGLRRLLDNTKLAGDKKTLLQRCHNVALVIAKATKEKACVIPNLLALERLIEDEQKQREQERSQHENEEEQHPSQSQVKKPKDDRDKKQKQQKQKNKNKGNTHQRPPKRSGPKTEAKTDSKPSSKPTGSSKPGGYEPAPQPEVRGAEIKTRSTAPSERHTITPVGNDKWSTVNLENRRQPSPVESVEPLSFTDNEKLLQLQLLLEKMVQLIEAYHQAKKPFHLTEQQRSDFMAGWHYMHGQICALLSLLAPGHMAFTELFDVMMYKDARYNNLGKHHYFPEGFWLLHEATLAECFPETTCFQAAIAMLENNAAPFTDSKKGMRAILGNWSRYVENAFEYNDIVKFVSIKSSEEFGEWIQHKIQHYVQRCRQLLAKVNNEERPAIETELAVRFFVTRIGELVGHLPLSRRSAFHQECRRFRNEAAHAFETMARESDDEPNQVLTLAEPSLDLVNLRGLLPPDDRLFFFNPKTDNPKNNNEAKPVWEFYVNPSYRYGEDGGNHDVTWLTNCYLQRLEKTKPYQVCQPITVTANSNLYDLMKKDITVLEATMENQSEGCLLIPATLRGEAGEYPVVIRLMLKKTEGANWQLTQIVANPVTNAGTEEVKTYIQSIPSKWKDQQKLPSIKIPEQKTVNYPNRCDHGVMQVALLSRLGHQYLTGNDLGYPKAKNTAVLIKKLRQEQIHDAWNSNDHDFYFRQQLLKKVPERRVPVDEVVATDHLSWAC